MMKNVLVNKLFFAVPILIIAQASVGAATSASERPLDRIVAVVNENVILESELEENVQLIRQQLSGRVELPPEDIFKKQILERLIVEQLQLDEAESFGITVDDITLNETIRGIARHNNLTIEGLRQQLLAEGIDYEAFRQERRKELILQRLRQGLIGGRVKISEAEINEYLTSPENENNNVEYRVSHIQISLPENANNEVMQEAQKRADSIYERLQKGEDFSKLAVAESEGRTALEGGDLGWRKPSELPKQFAIELRKLTPGKVSSPFRMSQGIHILKLHETKGVKRAIVKQVRCRHILLFTDALNTDEAVRKQLLEFRKQIQNGADFGKLAEKHSRDNGSAANGGEISWLEPDAFDPQFRKVLETLPVGKISEPFQTSYGWHIVEVLGWRDHDKTVELERTTAYQDLFERKAMIEEDLWVRRLRSEAFVDIRLDQ